MNTSNRFIQLLEYYRNSKGTSEDWDTHNGSRDLHNAFVRFQQYKESEFPEKISYYCSELVAKSIIGTGVLWLNDIRNMNDKSEIAFAVEHITTRLTEMKSISSFNDGLVRVIEESFLDLTDSSIWKSATTQNQKLILAMCFTQLKDDAAMWDRYASSGTGVSIEFNLKKLFIALKTAAIYFPNSLTFEHGFAKVCYAGKSCRCLENMHDAAIEAYQHAENDDERSVIRTMLHANVLEILVSHKHGSFSSELEIRIFSRVPLEKTWIGTDRIHEHGQGNRKSRHSEIFLPHQAINQSQDEFWQELINSVIIGPCASDETKQNIRLALESRGIGDRLSISSCPLRNFS